MDKNRFLHPLNEDRPYMLRHDLAEGGAPAKLDALRAVGFGGVVTNAPWHTSPSDPAVYLAADGDFKALDDAVRAARERGMGVWLYDEKGYPSASADGLTLLGHPEYEARGFTEIPTGGRDWARPDTFEKIIYACRDDGEAVPFDANFARGADRVFVVRPVFEGSHAQKCGWGPRHYPNLMDKDAVAAFIRCTYDRYFEKTEQFSRFEAVFTDEPSLMAGYVNCGVPMPYAFLPWAEDLPAVFREMHGRELWEDLPVLFSAVGPVVYHEIQQVNLFEHAVAEGFRVASRPGQALVVDFHQAPLVLKKLLHRIQDRLNLRKIDEGEGIGLVVRPLFFHGDKIIYDETAQVLDRHRRILCQRIQPLGIEPPGAGFGLLRGDHIIRIGGEHLCRLHRTHEAGVESHKIKMHAGGPERIADITKLQDIIRVVLIQPVPHERAAAVVPQNQGIPVRDAVLSGPGKEGLQGPLIGHVLKA